MIPAFKSAVVYEQCVSFLRIAFNLKEVLSLELTMGHSPCLLFVLRFRYFVTDESAIIMDELKFLFYFMYVSKRQIGLPFLVPRKPVFNYEYVY